MKLQQKFQLKCFDISVASYYSEAYFIFILFYVGGFVGIVNDCI